MFDFFQQRKTFAGIGNCRPETNFFSTFLLHKKITSEIFLAHMFQGKSRIIS